MAKIQSVKAREILDSRGNPTVEVELCTEDGKFVASVPSGASTGAYEATELRDGGSRYLGKGVLKAVANVNDVLGPAVIGMDPADQRAVDNKMIEIDGTYNKANMGANGEKKFFLFRSSSHTITTLENYLSVSFSFAKMTAVLGVSLAAAKAGAAANKLPLYAHFAKLAGNDQKKYTMPVPCFNVINGGSHAGNKLAFQEYFVIPTGATSFAEAMQIGCEVYHTLGKIIKAKFGGDATLIGDEGGFAPPCDNREGCELIMEALKKAGYEDKCSIGLDVAASEFRVKGEDKYDLDFKYDGNIISGQELGDLYQSLAADYPIVTIEDPFDEDDWENWSKFTAKNGEAFQVVGDDLTVTNIEKIGRAIDEKACTCLLLKVNQIGSVSESIDAVKKSKQAGWGVMTSHRSGETEDTYIADLAVGLCTGQIKTGAPCRSERLAKYNQLLRIEEELGAENTVYAGEGFRTTSWMG
mmetsp:Transcript_26940/g.55207  ORF Transcript_26940/g.55207 Transcript_26940/m.55207 type:complete len:469 (-) Transcript_26940:140-1546(-)